MRWLFGFGLFFLSLSAAGTLTFQCWQESVWHGSSEEQIYRVQILDDAVIKPQTLMYRVKTGNQQALVYLPKDSATFALYPADSLIIRARFRQTDFQYHRSHLIAATAFVRDWEQIEQSSKQPFNLRFTALKCRRYLIEHLHKIITDDKEFSVAAALMFGYRAEMDKDLQQTFAATGSAHILSVSGLHFSILYGILYFIFSFLGNSQRGMIIRQAIILPLLWFFAFMTGMPPPVVRAASMLTLWGIGNSFLLQPFSLNTVGVAAFFMLLYNPYGLFDVSFQLSFSAMLAILLIYPKLFELYQSRNPVLRYVWGMSCVSVAAQLGTAPLSIYYFHQFPLLFLLTNLFAIPVTGILLGLISVSLSLYFPFSSQEWLMIPLNKALHIFIAVLEWFESIPNGLLVTEKFSIVDMFCLFFSLISGIMLFFRKRIIYLCLIVIIVLFRFFIMWNIF
ncbi:MAG: ComEC/Rec2 family competence protein [Dysgonamonadaceae bacterium]|nr:ComEC/Rec2 family competence protein [Dysgonamonadaceae bacterium]